MSQFLELRLESVWVVSQHLMQHNFTLIVYYVSPGNSASIKQSPVNRHIQQQLSDMMFEQKGVCVWSRYQASLVGGVLCIQRVQSLNYSKEKTRKTENSRQRFPYWIFGDCLESLLAVKQLTNATQVDADSSQKGLNAKSYGRVQKIL